MTAVRTLLLSGICVLGACYMANAISAPPSPSQTTKPHVFESPDGQLEARITVANTSGEMVLELIDTSGRVLIRKDYSSRDQNGGLMLAQATWSQDSQFFIFSTWHVHGHQAMNSPTFAYSRDANLICSLEDRIGYIDVSDFEISPSDVLSTEVLDTKTQ